mmetsp:Transcript_30096/g.65673  ORF Transcript_30096/g.65673 Transcript_30096/m.65673 type:complete len:239 (+) Transcript_30096:272-988(+)
MLFCTSECAGPGSAVTWPDLTLLRLSALDGPANGLLPDLVLLRLPEFEGLRLPLPDLALCRFPLPCGRGLVLPWPDPLDLERALEAPLERPLRLLLDLLGKALRSWTAKEKMWGTSTLSCFCAERAFARFRTAACVRGCSSPARARRISAASSRWARASTVRPMCTRQQARLLYVVAVSMVSPPRVRSRILRAREYDRAARLAFPRWKATRPTPDQKKAESGWQTGSASARGCAQERS